jgi:hypothetical protein
VLSLSDKARLAQQWLYADENIGHAFAEKMTTPGHDVTSVLFCNANGESGRAA